MVFDFLQQHNSDLRAACLINDQVFVSEINKFLKTYDQRRYN